MVLSKAICFIAILLSSVFFATAQNNPPTVPPTKNLWIIACANGHPPKNNKNSFQQLAKMLIKEYGISATDSSDLFLFAPNLPNLFQPNTEDPGTQLASVPLLTVAEAGAFAPRLAAQFEQASRTKLDRAMGIIYPHLLVKQYFTNYSKFAYPPYTFDTIHTVVFSDQNNIYFESTTETTKAVTKNEIEHKKLLGKWYGILSNTEEDSYLRKNINRKIDGLYIKISQITATTTPAAITKKAFASYIKTATEVSQERDSINVRIRFGQSIGGIPVADCYYALGAAGRKTFTSATDSIVYIGSHTVPDSITMRMGFWLNDPLLGKKIIHRTYTMAFPPKAGFADSFLVNKKWWFIISGLIILAIPFGIWFNKRQQKLNNYKTGFYGIFNDVPEDKHRLPNKIQVYLFKYHPTGPSHVVLQPGHKKRHLQTFLFADGKLVVTASEKTYKQEPFFAVQAPDGSPIEVRAVRTTIWKLAKAREKTSHNNWIESIMEKAVNSINIETKETNIEMVLFAANRTLAHVHFSKQRSFPTLPNYYQHRMPALYHATNAINQLIATHSLFPLGTCNAVICMPGQKLGFAHITNLVDNKILLDNYTTIDAYQAPAEHIDDLIVGFLSGSNRCPSLVIGVGIADGCALYLPNSKSIRSETTLAAKRLMEVVEKNKIDRETPKEISKFLNISSLPFVLQYPNALSQPVFSWQVARFPLQLVLAKQILQKTFTKKLALSADGALSVSLSCSKKKNYALYLSPSKHPFYLRHINPIEKFYFQKNVPLTIDMNLAENQLLINGQSYDIKV